MRRGNERGGELPVHQFGPVGGVYGDAGEHCMTAIGDERSFSIYFEPQGDAKRTENVQAEIHYDMP